MLVGMKNCSLLTNVVGVGNILVLVVLASLDSARDEPCVHWWWWWLDTFTCLVCLWTSCVVCVVVQCCRQ
jgi:hypothetical protein